MTRVSTETWRISFRARPHFLLRTCSAPGSLTPPRCPANQLLSHSLSGFFASLPSPVPPCPSSPPAARPILSCQFSPLLFRTYSPAFGPMCLTNKKRFGCGEQTWRVGSVTNVSPISLIAGLLAVCRSRIFILTSG